MSRKLNQKGIDEAMHAFNMYMGDADNGNWNPNAMSEAIRAYLNKVDEDRLSCTGKVIKPSEEAVDAMWDRLFRDCHPPEEVSISDDGTEALRVAYAIDFQTPAPNAAPVSGWHIVRHFSNGGKFHRLVCSLPDEGRTSDMEPLGRVSAAEAKAICADIFQAIRQPFPVSATPETHASELD